MKILWLSHFIPYPPKGGVLQRGYHLLKQTALYHDVHLLAFNQKDLIAPLFNNLESGLVEAEQQLSEFCNTVSFIKLPLDEKPYKKKLMALTSLFRPTPYTMNWLESDEYIFELKKLLKNHKFDFIHFDTISLAPLIKYCSDYDTSLDHHNIESHMLIRRASKEKNWLKKFYFYQEGVRLKKIEKNYCPQFSFNFTCSDVDTKRLQDISPSSKVYTIPNGVDTTYFSPILNHKKELKLIFVGTLSWYPNIEAVVFIAEEIWPKIKNIYPNMTIDIIGANPPKEIVKLSTNDERFHVHGFVDDIRPLLNSALCYVCPIKDGGGTKLKIIDALSMGMAIIADEIAGEGINVTNNENILFASTGDEYITAISKLVNNQEKRVALQLKARMLAENEYSYNAIGKQLSELFIKHKTTTNP